LLRTKYQALRTLSESLFFDRQRINSTLRALEGRQRKNTLTGLAAALLVILALAIFAIRKRFIGKAQ
ncbi:MAG TPA: hypothetical protein PLM34_00765, partial [Lentimicrobium sp.]|nr:hypothetical protein [Lentimicrobium sp.]